MIESEKLYEEIKHFFYEKGEYDFVIEISDRPMKEWKLHFVFSLDEMRSVRCPMMNSGVDFAGFINCDGQYSFYFSDKNFFKSQDIRSGEIIYFEDQTFSEFDLKKVAEELRQLSRLIVFSK